MLQQNVLGSTKSVLRAQRSRLLHNSREERKGARLAVASITYYERLSIVSVDPRMCAGRAIISEQKVHRSEHTRVLLHTWPRGVPLF